MQLSIIIVNYNVKYFLEQCLCSVKKAIIEIDAEVFVVDNNSSDGSIDYLKAKFPWVKFIINEKNEGFSKANNKALRYASGEYVLFLNPDTIVAEDSLSTCFSFFLAHPDAGAVGVKMVDGCGYFLKESKRGFPSPWVAFCKLFGLTSIFPHSKLFAQYYLGNLSDNETQVTGAVSGAFFFTKKHILEKVGGFDEIFFMYAEDIDLSLRIQHAGYCNYFLATTTIIHFKGESTKRDFGYIKSFYGAMRLFVKKHFRSSSFLLFYFFISAGIGIRSVFAFIMSFAEIIGRKKNNNDSFFLSGDGLSVSCLEKKLSSQNIPVRRNQSESNAIVFCEGPDYSFKNIISEIQISKKPSWNCKFHSFESFSVVGSQNKKFQGSCFELNP
ncbi:MAG TPA: glycosyltransferase family 2 protein [Puia sp.]|nr:glycosyltransferase family 2 protein [Puia sp.]